MTKALEKVIYGVILYFVLIRINLANASNAALSHRLPGDTIPTTYEIFLSVHLDPEFRFDGKVIIHLTCVQETDKIHLHSSELSITSIKLNGDENLVESSVINEEKDFLIIQLKKKLVPKGFYTLEIVYSGKIRDDLTGLYRSSYITKGQEKRWLAVTQFQPSSARLVFPCYDEPHLKAFFNLSVEHDKKLNAISNMPMTHLIVDETRATTTFSKTLKMSTYLLAFLVSDYEAKRNDKNTVNLWTNKDSLDKAVFAHDFAQKSLALLEDHFGIYSMPKLDLADIPDFKMGAMENWGMCTFRTIYLIYDNKTSTLTNKLNAAVLVAHELSHSWFGNEVTPAWWDYLWLSEGMATILEAQITNEIFPEWKMMDQFVVKKMQYAMIHDSKQTARAMSAGINSKHDINFDFVVYQKAGSVLWMIENVLTQNVMRNGLYTYLQKWKGSIVDPNKLYASLEEADTNKDLPYGVELAKAMDSWTTQPGYPLITLTRNYTNQLIEVSQQRFLSDGTKDLGTKFWVPVSFANESNCLTNTINFEWLRPMDSSIILFHETSSKNWIIANKQLKGYYRVNYDEQNWLLLAEALNNLDFRQIHVLNRAQILDDSLNLALAGILNYNITLQLVSYLRQEIEYYPWTAAYYELNYIYNMLDEHESFQSFMKNLIEPVFKTITINQNEKDSITKVFLRYDLLFWVCKFKLQACSQTKEIADKWKSNGEIIVPDLRAPILCGALQEDDESLWNYVKLKLESATTVQERVDYIEALSCSDSKDRLHQYLSMTIDDKSILQAKERNLVFEQVYSSSKIGTEVALEFLVENKKEMKKLYNSVDDCIKGIAYYLTKESDMEKLMSISSLESAISSVKNNINWIEKNRNNILSWLETEGYKSSSNIHKMHYKEDLTL